MMIRARALADSAPRAQGTATGRRAEARALWLDSLGWARYGFGSDANVRAAEAEVLALDSAGKD